MDLIVYQCSCGAWFTPNPKHKYWKNFMRRDNHWSCCKCITPIDPAIPLFLDYDEYRQRKSIEIWR